MHRHVAGLLRGAAPAHACQDPETLRRDAHGLDGLLPERHRRQRSLPDDELPGRRAQGGVPPLDYRRALGVSNDGGRWCFINSGPRFPFEAPARHGARRVRDRFTGAELAEYLAAGFDLRPFDDADYLVSRERPGIVLHQTTNVHRLPEYTLAEVRAGRPRQRGSQAGRLVPACCGRGGRRQSRGHHDRARLRVPGARRLMGAWSSTGAGRPGGRVRPGPVTNGAVR